MLGRSSRHLYLLVALRARVVPARSAQRGGGKKPWKMQENIFLFWDFVFWRTARQGCAGAQRAKLWRAGGVSGSARGDLEIGCGLPGFAPQDRFP